MIKNFDDYLTMLKQLQTFLAVYQCGSFAAAGHQIGLTQSAVSAQIKNLEYQLGYPLFDRSGQKAVLTYQAQQALPHIQQLVLQFQDLQQLGQHTLAGKLNIGSIASVQTGMLPDVIAGFLQDAPHVHITIKPATSIQLLAMLESHQLDVALLLKPPFPLPKSLYQQEIAQQAYCLIVAEPISVIDPIQLLQTYPVIRYESTSFGGREVDRYLEKKQIHVREILVLDDLEAIVAMVERQIGIAIVPKVGLWLQRKAKVNLLELDAFFYRTVSAVMPYQQKNRAVMQLLLHHLNPNRH